VLPVVQDLARSADGIIVKTFTTENPSEEVVIACRGDEALKPLAQPSDQEQKVPG